MVFTAFMKLRRFLLVNSKQLNCMIFHCQIGAELLVEELENSIQNKLLSRNFCLTDRLKYLFELSQRIKMSFERNICNRRLTCSFTMSQFQRFVTLKLVLQCVFTKIQYIVAICYLNDMAKIM